MERSGSRDSMTPSNLWKTGNAPNSPGCLSRRPNSRPIWPCRPWWERKATPRSSGSGLAPPATCTDSSAATPDPGPRRSCPARQGRSSVFGSYPTRTPGQSVSSCVRTSASSLHREFPSRSSLIRVLRPCWSASIAPASGPRSGPSRQASAPSRSSSAREDPFRSWGCSSSTLKWTRSCLAGARMTTTCTAPTRSSHWPIFTGASRPALICSRSWRTSRPSDPFRNPEQTGAGHQAPEMNRLLSRLTRPRPAELVIQGRPMLDLKYVIAHTETVRQNCRNRNVPDDVLEDIDRVVALEAERKGLLSTVEEIRDRKNEVAQATGREKDPEKRAALIEEGKRLKA